MINVLKKNKLIRSVFSKCPERFTRYYRTYASVRQLLRATEYLSKDELEEFQFNKLRKIVNYTWNNVLGYRELWQKHNFNPEKLKELNDIHLIPFITKDILRDNFDKFTNHNLTKIHYCTTGGSTGIPFGFYLEEKNEYIEKAFIYDMWYRHYPPTSLRSKSTVLRGDKVKGIYEYDPLHGLTLSSYDINVDNVEKYIQFIEIYKTPIFQAYPSAIYLMAKIIKDNGLSINHNFESIMLGSEPLYVFQKELIQEVFNTRLCFWYGATEKVVLAGNCGKNDRFHIYPQYGITELVDTYGNPILQEGQTGEIVGTSFWNYATPFIRYKTMDYGELGQKYCEQCGRSYQLLNKIEGRLQDYIVDKEGNLVTLTALIFAQHFNAFSKIARMKLYQDKIGDVIVKIVPSIDFAKEDQLEIVDKMKTATSNKINVYIEEVENVDLTERGKLRFLDQHLDISAYM